MGRGTGTWGRVTGATMLVAAMACGGGADGTDTATAGGAAMSPAAGGADTASRTAGTPDEQMQAVLAQHAKLGPKPMETLTPQEARRQPSPADAVKSLLVAQGKDTIPTKLVEGIASVDAQVQGAVGNIPARIYTPEGDGPFPVILYFHGGGWVIADRNVYDGGSRGLAKAANAVVVSVDYRLAPEHKFPAQHEDAIAAYRWVLANAASIKGDPRRIALAGESAGGNLAVWTAVAARDASLQMPMAVVSVYPIAQPDTTTASYTTYADAKPLNRPMMVWFAKHATRTPADMQDPRINLLANNLRGLPPVTIILAEIDPLRDDGMMLERRLRDAGNAVELRKYDGVTHEFFGMGAVVDKAKDAQGYAGDRLKKAFGN